MPTFEAIIDTELDPLARAVMAAWDGEPAALRLVTSQPQHRLARRRDTPMPRPASNVVGFKRYAMQRAARLP